MPIVNLTPHAVVLRNLQGEDLTIPPTKPPARVAAVSVPTGHTLAGIPVCSVNYGDVENLPEPAHDTVYIVSAMVLGQCRGRNDVFAPGTGPQDGAVRNEAGQVVAVTRLISAEE